jgi:hypothetical protein
MFEKEALRKNNWDYDGGPNRTMEEVSHLEASSDVCPTTYYLPKEVIKDGMRDTCRNCGVEEKHLRDFGGETRRLQIT